MFNGLSVKEIVIQNEPVINNRERFLPASPIFIKRRTEKGIEFIKYDDERASEYLTETLKTKMDLAGIKDENVSVFFDNSENRARTQQIIYKGVKNIANWCPVIIKGKPETKAFAWNVGLGNSTGIGFGALK